MFSLREIKGYLVNGADRDSAKECLETFIKNYLKEYL